MRGLALLVVLLGPSALSLPSVARELISQEAPFHVGQNVTVCGTVAFANYAVQTKGQPTYLTLDQLHPRQVFIILIWGSDRPKFGEPEIKLLGRTVCANGLIESYKGKPQIVIEDPQQLSVK